MSPLSAPEPCPHLMERGTFVFCGIYDRRPEECRKHGFPARVCPVGASMLDLPTSDALRKRIDDGFAMTADGAAMLRQRKEPQYLHCLKPVTDCDCSDFDTGVAMGDK
jgi:hypothetical protein